MTPRAYRRTAAAIFSVVAVLHAARLIFGWHVEIGGWTAPMWLSWAALLIATTLAWLGFRIGGD